MTQTPRIWLVTINARKNNTFYSTEIRIEILFSQFFNYKQHHRQHRWAKKHLRPHLSTFTKQQQPRTNTNITDMTVTTDDDGNGKYKSGSKRIRYVYERTNHNERMGGGGGRGDRGNKATSSVAQAQSAKHRNVKSNMDRIGWPLENMVIGGAFYLKESTSPPALAWF